MTALFNLIDSILGILTFILFANIIISWLVHFNIINSYQPFVRNLLRFLEGVCDPLLSPVRRFLPSFGGMDFAPLIALLIIFFLRDFIRYDLPGLIH